MIIVETSLLYGLIITCVIYTVLFFLLIYKLGVLKQIINRKNELLEECGKTIERNNKFIEIMNDFLKDIKNPDINIDTTIVETREKIRNII